STGWLSTLVERDRRQTAELMREREALKQAVERARAHEALGAQEVRLRLLAEQVPALIWTTDSQLRFTSSMGAGLADMGLRPNQLAGMSVYAFFQTDDPNYRPIQAHHRALKGEPSIFEIEKAGHTFRTQVEPFLDADGAIIGTIAIALNITDRKQAEAALRRRDSILEAVSFVARHFLETANWTHTMQALLGHSCISS